MFLILFLRLSLLLFVVDAEGARSYAGYSLIRVVPQNERQLRYLNVLEENLEFEGSLIDVWRSSRGLNHSFELLLSPLISDTLKDEMTKMGFAPETLIEDVEEAIEAQSATRLQGRDGSPVDYFDNYHPLDEMFAFLDSVRDMNPRDSKIEIIGKSYEDRELKLLRIGDSNTKPLIWIDGGTHAREWIGPTTVLYMAYQVASAKQACRTGGYCPQDTARLVNTFDFAFMPSVNPDGYEFSRSSDRLWRKTRSESSVAPWSVFCKGTDPNRNYNAKWGGAGSSGNPCSQTYAGKEPHSEKEIKALTDKVTTLRDRVKLFVSLHSYSQIMLLPYGHSTDIPEEYPDLERLATLGAEALKSKYGTEYKIGASARILYAASGTASDWAFETAGVKYSYTFELPDTGDQGFLLPPERIKPVGEETWAAISTMAANLI